MDPTGQAGDTMGQSRRRVSAKLLATHGLPAIAAPAANSDGVGQMRRTINISVSEEMHSVILDRTRDGCYDSVSEYIRALIRKDKFASMEQEIAASVRPMNDYIDYYIERRCICNTLSCE